MDIGEVKEFMKKSPWGILATSDGRRVGARPMGGLAWKGNELWCATFSASDKIAQLKRVPYAEYCFCDPKGRHVRIAGPCSVSIDNAEKLWLYKAVPSLKDHISDPASPQYVVIKMKPDNIRFMNSADLKYTQIEIK